MFLLILILVDTCICLNTLLPAMGMEDGRTYKMILDLTPSTNHSREVSLKLRIFIYNFYFYRYSSEGFLNFPCVNAYEISSVCSVNRLQEQVHCETVQGIYLYIM